MTTQPQPPPQPQPLPRSLHDAIDAMAPVTARFEAAGHRLYLVGGAVRDHLLGKIDEPGRPGGSPGPAAESEPGGAGADAKAVVQDMAPAEAHDEIDFDATTDARPATIKALLGDLAEQIWTQGERFGTIGLAVKGRRYEITTHRAEIYDDASRKPQVRFGDDIAEDLARRDFTVNAMAVDLSSRELVDPYGGMADLEKSLLRTPLAPEVSFSDDPLRMLRAARFRARLGLVPDEALLQAIPALLDRMEIVSAERIGEELQKLLMLTRPSQGLAMLADTGLLGRVIPALTPVIADHGRWGAALARVDAAQAGPEHRWAALLADVEQPGETASSLRLSNALSKMIEWLVSARELPGVIDDPVLRVAAAKAPQGRSVEELLGFAGRHDECNERLAALRAAEPDLDNPAAPLSGLEVAAELGVEPGPVVGEAMKWLARRRVEHGPLSASQARAALAAWQAERDD